jgi:hypothetical protein
VRSRHCEITRGSKGYERLGKRSVISTDPLPPTKPTALEWKSVTPDLEASFPFQRLTLQ